MLLSVEMEMCECVCCLLYYFCDDFPVSLLVSLCMFFFPSFPPPVHPSACLPL